LAAGQFTPKGPLGIVCIMEHSLIVPDQRTDIISQSEDRVRNYLANARARNTIRGYRSSFHQFQLWCDAAHLNSMPATPETVAMYLSSQADQLATSTLAHHLAAINKAHKAAGYGSPTQDSMLVAETFKGIKRTHGTAAVQKAPILTEDLRLMLRAAGKDTRGIRDRALLLAGFAGAFRRSELVALDVSDLDFNSEGLLISLRRSKTDQEGAGRKVAIPYGSHEETCPVRAVLSWLTEAAISAGPVFRPIRKGGAIGGTRLTGHSVAAVVKRFAVATGLDGGSFSGHSLRAGFVTSAARAGEPERRTLRSPGKRIQRQRLQFTWTLT
jgi:integrase